MRPKLAKQELVLSQYVSDEGVSTVVYHETGQWISFPPLKITPVGATPQHVGSAISYARRYSILAVCGLATEDDDARVASSAAGPDERPIGPDPIAERVDAAARHDEGVEPARSEQAQGVGAERDAAFHPARCTPTWTGCREIEAYLGRRNRPR